MDTKSKLLAEIERLLTTYASWITQGSGTRSDASEDLYCDLLNTALEYELKNMNWVDDNFPAIDLGDDEEGLAVQVTSTGTADKVKGTLSRFYGHKLNQRYRRLIVLIAGEAKCKPDKFDHPGLELEIWGTVELMQELRKLSAKKLRAVEAFLKERVDAPQRSGPMPIQLPVTASLGDTGFVGRHQELERMAQALQNGVKPLVIWGLGGMGKTELVSQFGRSYKGGNVYMTMFRESFFDTVVNGIADGIPELRDRELSPEERYALAMERLRQCAQDDILIIDNADRDTGSFADLKQDPAYKELCGLPLHLVITTRFEVRRGVELNTLKREELYQIFENHGVSVEKHQMDELIEAVDSHTMTVDLMARTMRGGWKRVTADMLLRALRERDLPNQQYREIEADYNRTDRQERIYGHLKILFNVAEIPVEAKDALRCATLLPLNGMDSELFGNVLPEGPQNTLNGLIDHGWLRWKEDCLTIHPVIRLVCWEELNPTEENCGAFLNGLWDWYDPNQYDKEKYLQLAELFTAASKDLTDPEGDWAINAGIFWKKLGEARRALECNLQAAAKLEKNRPDSTALARAYNNVGSTYGDLGDHARALEYKKKALAIREKVLPPEHPDLAHSYNNVGNTYYALGNLEGALEYMQKALAICEKVLPPEHPDLAVSYNNVGSTYGYLGDNAKALEYELKSLAIREKVLPPEHPDLATSYNNVGNTYGNLGDHTRALEYLLKALSICEKVLPPEHPDLATSYNNVGSTYGNLGDHARALEYKLKALSICEKVLPPDHPSLATSYNNVGSTYSALGDHARALEYMLKDLAICEKVLPPEHPNLAASYNNVGLTYGYLGSHAKALEYQLKALAILENSLPEDHPSIVVLCSNISATYAQMGDFSKASEYADKALEKAERSMQGHPKLEMYRRAAEMMKLLAMFQEMGIDPNDFLENE